MSESPTVLSEADVRTLATWFGPDYFIEAAESATGDAVSGAPFAAREVRGLARNYLAYVRSREGLTTRDLGPALILRAMGWRGKVPELIRSPRVALSSQLLSKWPERPLIPGWCTVEVGDASQGAVDRAVEAAIRELLDYHAHMRQVILRGKAYWFDKTPRTLMSVDIGNQDIRLLPIVPGSLTRGLLRRVLRAERHPLAPVGRQLARAWAEVDPIWSPGVAMISYMGSYGIQGGWAAIPPGMTLSVVVGAVRHGQVMICLNIDHRAWTGRDAGGAYECLRERVKQCA